MSDRSKPPSTRRRQAQFRLAVIGDLLAAPPAVGRLSERLDGLAVRVWRLPDGASTKLGRSTIERWYYLARDADDPLAALTRARRSDADKMRVMAASLLAALAIRSAQGLVVQAALRQPRRASRAGRRQIRQNAVVFDGAPENADARLG